MSGRQGVARWGRFGILVCALACVGVLVGAEVALAHPTVPPRPQDLPAASGDRAARAVTTGRVDIAVVILRPRGAPRYVTGDSLSSLVFGAAWSIRRQFAAMSGGRMRLAGAVYGAWPVPADTASCAYCLVSFVNAAARRRGLSLAGYDKVVIFVDNGEDWALAQLGGRYAWIASCECSDTFTSRRTTYRYGLVHELGHTFGLAHAHAATCSNDAGVPDALASQCLTVEYGDRYDSMGVGFGAQYSWSNRRFLGWVPPERMTVVTTDGSYQLTPGSSTGEGVKLLRIPLHSPATGKVIRYLEVETRQLSGFDGAALGGNSGIYPGTSTTGVLVRTVTTASAGTTLIDATPVGNMQQYDMLLQPGATITDPQSGVSVTLDSEFEGNAQLTVDVTP